MLLSIPSPAYCHIHFHFYHLRRCCFSGFCFRLRPVGSANMGSIWLIGLSVVSVSKFSVPYCFGPIPSVRSICDQRVPSKTRGKGESQMVLDCFRRIGPIRFIATRKLRIPFVRKSEGHTGRGNKQKEKARYGFSGSVLAALPQPSKTTNERYLKDKAAFL